MSKYTFHQVSWTGSPSGPFQITDIFSNGVLFGEVAQRGFGEYVIETTSGGNATFGDTNSYSQVGPWTVLPEMMNQQGERAGYAIGLGTIVLDVNGNILPGDIASPSSISDSGFITGGDGANHADGFLYTPSGAFIQFPVPGAATVYGTSVANNGTVLGFFQPSAGGPTKDFVREPTTGQIKEFTPLTPPIAGATQAATSSEVSAVNSSGWIVGTFFDGLASHGFLISPSGEQYQLDAPGAVNTSISAINDAGEIAGAYSTAHDSFSFTADVGGTNLGGTLVGDAMTHPMGKITFHTS